jgi:hypothetical protein
MCSSCSNGIVERAAGHLGICAPQISAMRPSINTLVSSSLEDSTDGGGCPDTRSPIFSRCTSAAFFGATTKPK